VSLGHVAAIPLDAMQSRDLLLTLAQSLLGALFLINMELAWWEAAGLFVLFLVQMGSAGSRVYVTWIYFAWCGVEALRLMAGNRKAASLRHFRDILWPAK